MLCETENLNFAVYFTIDKHSYEQVHLKVEPKSFLYEFLNSGDPLYSTKGKIQENYLFALKKTELTREKNSKTDQKDLGTILIGSIVAGIFNPKDNFKLLS